MQVLTDTMIAFFWYNDFTRTEKFELRSLLSWLSTELWSVPNPIHYCPKATLMTGYKSLQKELKGRGDLNKIFEIFKIIDLKGLLQPKWLYQSMIL